MVVSVVLSGLPQYVTLQDLGSNLDKVFDTDYIKTFHIRDLPDHPTSGKRRVALDFKSGFDGAMEAQSLLDGYKYSLDNGKTYILKAKVNHDPALRRVESFDDHAYESCLVQYQDMAHGRILDMHLDSLKKQREVIRSERKLLKEKKKLKREIKELNDSEDSSDSEKKRSKKHKKHDKKKHKKRKRVERRPSNSLSSSEGELASTDRSDARSRSPSARRRMKSPSIEEFRPKAEPKSLRARLGGSALVPYPLSPRTPPRAAPASPSPLSTRLSALMKRETESPARRERSRSRRSDSPPKRRASSRWSPEPGRRAAAGAAGSARRLSARSSASARRSRSASPPAPPKRARASATPTPTPYPTDRQRGYTWSSPSPPRSRRFEKSERHTVVASTSRGERERERERERDRERERERERVREREREKQRERERERERPPPKAYQLADDDEHDFNKDIDDLLESVNKESASSDESPSRTVNINLKMNVVKSGKAVEKEQTKKTKPKKKMPLPIKKEESDEDKPIARAAFKDIRDCMPKPMVDQKAVNIKKERREMSQEDIEDGEIHEIEDDDEDEDSDNLPILPSVDYANLPWVPVHPEEAPSPRVQAPLIKTVPLNPRFVLPITKIINSMKKYYSDLEKIEKYRMNAVLKDLLLARLKVMLKNEKGYKCTKEILVIYREHHPVELDEQFVKDTLKEIEEGLYDVWIDDDPAYVQIKQEKEDCKENIRPVAPRAVNGVGAGAGADVSGQWVPFKPVVEPDDDILILEPEKPTLDLTATDDHLINPDIDSTKNISDISKVVKEEIKIDTSEAFDFLKDTISAAKGSDASDTTVVLGAQSPSAVVASLKVEPADDADLGPPVAVKQEPTVTDTTSAEVVNPTATKTEPEQISDKTADKSPVASDPHSDNDMKIKIETEETLDDIAKFIQEVEVVKKVIDLTEE